MKSIEMEVGPYEVKVGPLIPTYICFASPKWWRLEVVDTVAQGFHENKPKPLLSHPSPAVWRPDSQTSHSTVSTLIPRVLAVDQASFSTQPILL